MARHTFHYTSFNIPPTAAFPDGQTVFRPLLIARLFALNGMHCRFIVWPDSGADQCLFPLSLAQALSLDPLSMKSQLTGGVGNTRNTTYYDRLRISIESGPEFEAHVGFTAGLEAQGFGLLGQAAFFENFVVSFDLKSRLFYIDD